LNPRKIIKIVASRCILKLKSFFFLFLFSTDLLDGFKGPTSEGRGEEGRAREGDKGEEVTYF